jgi:hypothetical protein
VPPAQRPPDPKVVEHLRHAQRCAGNAAVVRMLRAGGRSGTA